MKKIRLRRWVVRLLISKGACLDGAQKASRFTSATEAWMKTNDPYELMWVAGAYFDALDGARARGFWRGWNVAQRCSSPPENRRFCRAFRLEFSRPDGFR